ncbi:uncharacterized protein N7482_005645 [Penicillium canariense]|uniref:Uncharacterized protein n=1 Tax=Penicillium canariense TaxID=189055 RepID=A0A9W9I569_9EURO|nr:uncharacterized protein N7482_005645 [Penicillium canariense]KAJ5166864.1 hypothetical protein N7482_005645 [Penicillium canariense]
MFTRVLLALGGVSAAYAQTTVGSPFLAQWLILSDYSVSTVAADDAHTTYNIKCDSEATLCSLPATGVAVVTAPSYVGLSYTEPSETFTSSVGCTYIDARASAVCTTLLAAPNVAVQSGSFVTGMTTLTSTVTLPAASVELGFNTAATTAAASQATETVASATTAASHSETATETSATASATKTGGASEAFGHGNSGLIVGVAMAGLALL